MSDEIIRDADFEEVSENSKDKIIRGRALYFSTGQVADMLDIPESTVRYYSSVFDDILNIEFSNKRRRYKEEDIDKLRFIKSLIDDGMTLKQVKEYCDQVEFNNGEVVIKEDNPLSIQAVAKALLEEQQKQIELMKMDILSQLKEFVVEQSRNQQMNMDEIKRDICIAIDDSVGEKLDNTVKELKDTFKMSYVSRVEIEQINKKKNWFSKIFK